MKPQAIINMISSSAAHSVLVDLYGENPAALEAQQKRINRMVRRFEKVFPHAAEVSLFSSPGRTEVGGNHTDHNAGRVLAAAVDLDILAVAAPTNDRRIVIDSEGYRKIIVDIDQLEIVEQEKSLPAALVRGICARMVQLGYYNRGFPRLL